MMANNTTIKSSTRVSRTSDAEEEDRDGIQDKPALKPQVVRIEVLGDEKVGKTTLICSLVSRHFSEKVPSVLLNVQIPAEESNENVVISITDTSSRISELMRVVNATKRSDAILLVYDLTRPETFQRLRRWLDLIAKQKPVPVVLVANKADAHGVQFTNEGPYSNQIRHLINTYPFCVVGVQCSAKNFAEVAQAFYLAQKAVLYPVEPLYNVKKKQLEPLCVKAIKRAFRLYSREQHGVLSRDEVNDFQYDCFGMRLLPAEMDTLMEFLSSAIPDGVTEDGRGLLFEGFKHLWELFIIRNRPESCWQVLRSLGYTNDLRLEIPLERIAAPFLEVGQSTQLTTAAIEFLEEVFKQSDTNDDQLLDADEIREIFSICDDTDPPWCNWMVAYARKVKDGKDMLSLDSWLACWTFLAQEDPARTLATLFFLGYNDKASPALEVTKRRDLARNDRRIERNCVTCALYPATSECGKRSLLDGFLHQETDGEISKSDEADVDLCTAISAVPFEKDKNRFLLLTESMSPDLVDHKADVVCILFNPLDKEVTMYLDRTNAQLPENIPRVYVAWKPESIETNAPEWEIATKTLQSTLPADASFKIFESPAHAKSLAKHLVQMALQPPRPNRTSQWKMTTPRALVMGTGVAALAIGVAVYARKQGDGSIEGLKHAGHSLVHFFSGSQQPSLSRSLH